MNIEHQTSNIKLTFKAWPVIAIATIGLCQFTQWISTCLGLDLDEQNTVNVMRQLGVNLWNEFRNSGWSVFDNPSLSPFLANLALILIGAPAIEEFVFRFVLTRLPLGKKRFFAAAPGRVTVAVCIGSSALFSAAHYIQAPFPDNAFLALFFFGLAQCWLYRKTERLWCPILNHGLFNLTNLVLLFALPQ